jgi:hypothetical protein
MPRPIPFAVTVGERLLDGFSYTNPNLQQVPARDPELGKMIRSLSYRKKG